MSVKKGVELKIKSSKYAKYHLFKFVTDKTNLNQKLLVFIP